MPPRQANRDVSVLMIKMDKDHIIDTIEKLFRYFIPGFIFIFMFKLAFPSKPQFILENIGQVEFYIYVPCIGMVIYGLHRFIHEPSSFMDIHKCTILLIALIIFIFAFLLTLIMYLTEKELYNSLNDA